MIFYVSQNAAHAPQLILLLFYSIPFTVIGLSETSVIYVLKVPYSTSVSSH